MPPENTPFSDLSALCEELKRTTKRTEKIELLEVFLAGLKDEEIAPAVSLITGRVFSGLNGRTLEVGWKTIQRVERRAPDLTSPLTILDVQRYFSHISSVSGKGSREKRERLLGELLARATPLEQEYIVKNIFGEMQHGVGEGVMMAAIAETAEVSLELIRKATMYTGSLGEVARVALTRGGEGLEGMGIQLFRPIQPMLAQVADDVGEALVLHKGRSAFEFKFDGARVQLHKRGKKVKIFSRRLSEVTGSLPEIVHAVREKVRVDEAILDGEVVAMGEGGKPLPFQEVMRRFRRVHKIEELVMEVPVRLWLFDLLYMNGEELVDRPYQERWRLLSELGEEGIIANRIVTDSTAEAQGFLQKAMESGHEGLMAKELEGTYTPGARGDRWLKIKPTETMDLVILAADWGYGRRTGWLSNYHLGAREGDEFRMIGKTFKGLTDKQFQEMTRRLSQLKTLETDYTVFVKPRIVVEVAFNEIQRSPHYPSGFALRFARIKSIRYDKSPGDADTIDRVSQLYQRQFKHKAKKGYSET